MADIHPWFKELNRKPRKPVLFVFVGEPGTGKSTMMKNFMAINNRNLIVPSNMLEAPETWGKLPVIKPVRSWIKDDSDYKGKRKVLKWILPHIESMQGIRLVDVSTFNGHEEMYQFLPSILDPNNPDQGYSKGGFFLDDTKNYIVSNGTMPHGVQNILRARRHLGIDFFFAVHRFQDINSEFFGFGARLFIFKTNTPPSDAALAKFDHRCVPQLQETIQYVNAQFKNNPHYYEPFDPSDPEANEWVKKHRR